MLLNVVAVWLQSGPAAPCSVPGSSDSTFLPDQDSFLLHSQYGDSFTELVDDLLALMSYIL